MPTTKPYRGTDRALAGIVLAVLTFWLFSQTILNLGPEMAHDIGLPQSTMNIAIALAALFSGMFIVVIGGLADQYGRVRVVLLGNLANILGSLLIAFAISGHAGTVMLLGGRILQGLAAGSIMPASMALLKAYWRGHEQQRAVSMWSIGSWGGGGLCSFFGGIVAATPIGWRGIFVMSALVSVISIFLMREIPESAPASDTKNNRDWPGVISFVLAMISIQIVMTQGASLGWTSPAILAAAVIFVAAFGFFLHTETRIATPFVDFSVFRNRIFTGATISNFMLNAVAGIVSVTLWVLQQAWGMSATKAGYVTIGYAVFIISFIRVGEVLLRRFGPRLPMLWGSIIVLASIAMLLPTHTSASTYTTIAYVSFCLFGIGLAFYATPSTYSALAALPDAKAGAGSGIYKMASSLGAAFGVASSTAIFTAISAGDSTLVGRVFTFAGSQENIAVREAGMYGIGLNALMALIAIVSIWVFIPKKMPVQVRKQG